MRYFGLAALIAATLALGASGQTGASAQIMQESRFFAMVNNTSPPPAAHTDAAGESCAGTLEAKCPSQSEWTPVITHAVDLECTNTDDEVSYREPATDTEENVSWACSVNGSNAPEGAYRSTQIVRITGELNGCDASPLTAQSECEYHCRDAAGTETQC